MWPAWKVAVFTHLGEALRNRDGLPVPANRVRRFQLGRDRVPVALRPFPSATIGMREDGALDLANVASWPFELVADPFGGAAPLLVVQQRSTPGRQVPFQEWDSSAMAGRVGNDGG